MLLVKTASMVFYPLVVRSFLPFIISVSNLSLWKVNNISASANEKFTLKSHVRITCCILSAILYLCFSFPLALEQRMLLVVNECHACTFVVFSYYPCSGALDLTVFTNPIHGRINV